FQAFIWGMSDKMKAELIFLGPFFDRILDTKKIRSLTQGFRIFDDVAWRSLPNVQVPTIASDDFIYHQQFFNLECDISIVVVEQPLDGNFFTRTNVFNFDMFGLVDPQPEHIVFSVSTNDVYFICKHFDLHYEKAMAGIILLAFLVYTFLSRGGKYWNLVTESREDSVFNFCRDKTEMRYSMQALKMGQRAEAHFQKVGFDETELAVFRRALATLRPTTLERITGALQERPISLAFGSNILVSIVFFALGAMYAK
ncbi:MAG: hypothetical protein ACKOEE_10735, partial [Tagaea sp.]